MPRDQDRVGFHGPRPAATGALQSGATRRNARARSRTNQPSHNSPRRDRRWCTTGSGRATLPLMGADPSLSGDSARARARWMGPVAAGSQGAACRFALEIVLEEHARVGDHPCLALLFAAQERGSVFANGRKAAGLQEQDRLAARSRVVKMVGVGLSQRTRLLEQALRDERAAAADVRQEPGSGPGGCEQVDCRQPTSGWM